MTRDCKNCKGAGQVMCFRCDGTGTFQNGYKCNYCHGKRVIKCEACDGSGKVDE